MLGKHLHIARGFHLAVALLASSTVLYIAVPTTADSLSSANKPPPPPPLRAANQTTVALAQDSTTSGRPEKQKQQQQQLSTSRTTLAKNAAVALGPTEIACDDYSLLILAQRSLSGNASEDVAHRLIECNRRMAKRNANVTLVTSTNTRPVAEFIVVDKRIATGATNELHFGAKVAILLLLALVFLVSVATFVDFKQERSQRAKTRRIEHNQSGRQLRDTRSLSVSSCSSTGLFCSASSVASSSAPILSHQDQCGSSKRLKCHLNMQSQLLQRQLLHHHTTGCSCSGAPNSCYLCSIASSNSNGNGSSSSSSSSSSSGSSSSNYELHTPTGNENEQHQQQQQEIRSRDAIYFNELCQRQQPIEMAEEAKLASSPTGGLSVQRGKKATLKKLLLSFSLRHSARQIFYIPKTTTTTSTSDAKSAENSTTSSASSPSGTNYQLCIPCACHLQSKIWPVLSTIPTTTTGGHRSRVSSLSSIAERNIGAQKYSSDDDANTCISLSADSNAASRSVRGTPQLLRHCCDQNESKCANTMAQPNESSNNRASSHITFDNNTDNESHHLDNSESSPTSTRPSIDSLHGLRFISMIWVIVIHSYNFALRWLFFSNSAQLEDLYKSTASQLLANGSFACDSFFFAGGFLLPYLAFPEYQPKQPATKAHRASPSPCAHEAQAQGKSLQNCDTLMNTCCYYYQLASNNAAIFIQGTCDDTKAHQKLPTLTKPNSNQCQQQSSSNQQKLSANSSSKHANEFTFTTMLANIFHRYVRMMPLMMAIIGLSTTLLRYLGDGPNWQDSTMMYDKWCRKNWWVNVLFLHNFINRENMCLSHSWYSAVDIQLFLCGQVIMFVLFKSRKLGVLLLCAFLFGTQLITGTLTMMHNLPAVPLVARVSEQTMNLYYGEIYIKPYCRASPYLIGILLAYLMRTTSLSQLRLNKWQLCLGWTAAIGTYVSILMAMQPAMNGQTPSELESALYSALSRPLWACATGWMIFACMTNQGGFVSSILSARCFVPLSRLTYPAFLIHPIVIAVFYGSRETSFHFSHYLMLYLILGNIVITYASAFILSALFELPLLSLERTIKGIWSSKSK